MTSVVQRVTQAAVSVEGRPHAAIGPGLLALVGARKEDAEADARWLGGKIAALRVFEDDDGRMNRSLANTGGDVLAISQFTLLARNRKGNRPSFNDAAPPDRARLLYQVFLDALRDALGKPPASGVFAASMQVSLVNDGPVTLILDSRSP